MSTGAPAQVLLAELDAAPVDALRARFADLPDPRAALLDLIEELKRSAMTDLAVAERRSAVLIALADSLGVAACRARAWAARGHVLAYLNRFDESLAHAERGAALAIEHAERFEWACATLASVQPLSRLGRADGALASAGAAGDEFRALGEPVWAAKADVNAGVILRLRDRPAEALARFDRAREHFADVPMVLAQIDSNRAEALLELNRFAEAERAFVAALGQFERGGNDRAAVIVRGNLADLHRRLGRIRESLRDYELAMRVCERGDTPGDLARLRAEHAEVMGDAGLVAEAVTTLERAGSELRDHGLFWESARAALALARLLLRSGEASRAREAAAAALGAFEALAHASGAAHAGVLMAQVDAGSADAADPTAPLDHAVKLLNDRPADHLFARLVRADVLVRRGVVDVATLGLDEAVASARRLGIPPLLAEALRLRGRLHLTHGRPKEALGDFSAAMDAVERVRGALPGDRLRASLVGDRLDVFEAAVEAGARLGGADGLSAAFDAIQRARARSLLDLMASDPGAEASSLGGSGDAELLAEHDRLVGELGALYSTLSEPQRSERPLADAWHAAVAAREKELAAVELRLASTRSFGDLYVPPCDLPAVRSGLAPGDALVEFFSTGSRLVALVVRPDARDAIVDLGDAAAVATLSERLRFEVSRALVRRPSLRQPAPRSLCDGAKAVLGALHAAVLAPLVPHLDGVSRLAVVPHGPLHAVPFEAMWSGAQYVVESLDVSYVPSASVMRRLGERRRGAAAGGARALVVGVPDASAPAIAAEARDVGETLRARVLMGEEATFERFAALAPGCSLIHVGCHAVASGDAPMSGRLRFADRWVTAREIALLALNADTVVLAGCDTGRGTAVGCDDVFGLARAFIIAGANSLVVSRWLLHDESAAELMGRVYRGVAATRTDPGAGVRAALRKARIEMAREGHHPALWAPFMLIGNP